MEVRDDEVGVVGLPVEGATATITPVRPPAVKMNRKPMMKSAGVVSFTRPAAMVAIQAKT
jgi:hypothetical protein